MYFPVRCFSLPLLLLSVVLVFAQSESARAQPAPSSPASSAKFQLHPGDRVVLLGDGLIEQEQYHGWVEVMLTRAFANAEVTFRNLGWSADTPAGASRNGLSLLQAGHEPADEGWKQLQNQLRLVEPTVVILGYGMASSLERGADGIDAFVAEYEQLLRYLQELNPDSRFLFLSPLARVEASTSTPLISLDHQQALTHYRQAIAQLAANHDSPCVDLSNVATDATLRRDAIHLNDAGYQELAAALEESLNLTSPNWRNANTLRHVILQKNQWFFHRSRPANMAYVFGFRKREQGQNAVEIPQFDALVAAEEKRIAQLRASDAPPVLQDTPRTRSAYAKFQRQPLPEFTTADGWQVTLWAENPMLNKPIQINFDTAGRLWVASSEAYPMIEVGQTANDRVIVLEDTNGDGTADSSRVFADGLLIPTGVLPTDDGVFVAQSTDLLYLQDTDGDGTADQKSRILSGFGTEDTHHNLHTLRWGPDGRMYLNQSVYTRTDAETPRGITRLKAGGGFRFEPDTMRMQVFFAGLWNSWGHQFDRWGRSFMSDGAGFSGFAYVFPGAQFSPVPGGQRVLDLISPGNYPKFCSAEIVEGDTFPHDWQHSIVTCDFRANRVTRFSLIESGAGFQTVQQDDLLRTSTATFRPIDVKQGPDGALYIADWSNPIINHGEVDFRDPRRDRWHGRIWRVARHGKKAQLVVDFTRLETDALLAHLSSNDRYARDRARRVLLSRPQHTLAALSPWIAAQTDAFALLQALWLHQGLRVSNERLLANLLRDDSADVRAAAVRVLADWADPQTDCTNPLSVADARAAFAELIRDPHPRVRLEAIVGLTSWRTDQAARLALQALDPVDGKLLEPDRFIEFALAELIGDASDSLLPSIQQEPLPDHQLVFTLYAVKPDQAVALLRDHLKIHSLASDGGPWVGLIGKAGGVAELDRLFEAVVMGKLNEAGVERALQSLADAQRLRKLRPQQRRDEIRQLFSHDLQTLRILAIRLAGLWKQESSLAELQAMASDPAQAEAVRLAAVETLGELSAMQPLVRIAQAPPATGRVAAAALAAVAQRDAAAGVQAFGSLDLAAVDNPDVLVTLWRAVLSGKGSEKLLVPVVGTLKLGRSGLETGLRVAREGGREAPELVETLQGALGSEAKVLSPEEVKAIALAAEQHGDPHRGELVFRNQELACVTCHAIAGVGGKVGPDLSSIGASAPIDYIAESLYLPNAKIKENYHSVILVTVDGRQLTGIESPESNGQERVIRDASDQLVRIPRNDIADEVGGPSLMPSGLVERLPQGEQLDLIRFLSLLGKPGDFDTSRRDVARGFHVLAGTHRLEQQGNTQVVTGEAEGWQKLPVRVSGVLDKQTILDATKQRRNISLVTVYLKTFVEVASEATVKFQANGAASAWIDGKEVVVEGGAFAAPVAAGKHTLVLQFDARQLPTSVRLTSSDVVFVSP